MLQPVILSLSPYLSVPLTLFCLVALLLDKVIDKGRLKTYLCGLYLDRYLDTLIIKVKQVNTEIKINLFY